MHLSFRMLRMMENGRRKSCDGCQLMALVVVVVIAIDKPQKRKAYKAQSALLRTEVNLPKQIVHMHIHIHIHTNTTVQCSYTGMKSPTAAYKLLVCYFTLFWIKSKNPLLPFNLFFSLYPPFCVSSLTSIKMIVASDAPLASLYIRIDSVRICYSALIFIRFYCYHFWHCRFLFCGWFHHWRYSCFWFCSLDTLSCVSVKLSIGSFILFFMDVYVFWGFFPFFFPCSCSASSFSFDYFQALELLNIRATFIWIIFVYLRYFGAFVGHQVISKWL